MVVPSSSSGIQVNACMQKASATSLTRGGTSGSPSPSPAPSPPSPAPSPPSPPSPPPSPPSAPSPPPSPPSPPPPPPSPVPSAPSSPSGLLELPSSSQPPRMSVTTASVGILILYMSPPGRARVLCSTNSWTR